MTVAGLALAVELDALVALAEPAPASAPCARARV